MLDLQKVQEIIKPMTAQIPEGIKLSKSEFLQPKQAKPSKDFFCTQNNYTERMPIGNNYELTNEWNFKYVNYQLSLCKLLPIFLKFFIPSISMFTCSPAISATSTQKLGSFC